MKQGMASNSPATPAEFTRDVPDPRFGVALKRRVRQTKHAVSGDQVYEFARDCIDLGIEETKAAAAAAVIANVMLM
jgi:hypothetical protein